MMQPALASWRRQLVSVNLKRQLVDVNSKRQHLAWLCGLGAHHLLDGDPDVQWEVQSHLGLYESLLALSST
mgnify:CR=1 FL=1